MRPRQELLERSPAADPAPHGEHPTSVEREEAGARLAPPLAGAEQRGDAARRVRRWLLPATFVVGAAAAGLAATGLLNSEDPVTGGAERAVPAGVVGRAAAAATRDHVIYHVVERRDARASYEPHGDIKTYVETWHTSDGRIHERTFAAKRGRKGRPLEDWAGRRLPGRRVWPRLRWDAWTNTIREGGFGPGPDSGAPALDFFGDHGAQLRRLQAQGRLRVAGTTRVRRRPAYRLVSGPVQTEGGEERVEFTVNVDTYYPLARRYSARQRSSDPESPTTRILILARYLVYERLPLNARNRALLHLDPHPGARCSRSAGRLTGERRVGFGNPCPPADHTARSGPE
jgi:hypothetical protein